MEKIHKKQNNIMLDNDKFLIDEIFSTNNIQLALEILKNKKNSMGKDGVQLKDLESYWRINSGSIIETIKSGHYQPAIVRQFEIVSYKKKKRLISIISSVDRLIAKAINQVLVRKYDYIFSEYSFAYRPGRGIQDCVKACANHIEDKYIWLVDIDIQKYFDTISHQILLEKFADLTEDKVLLALIGSFVKCEVENDLGIYQNSRGILQGLSFSPFLSNLYLNDFDKYCESNSIRFCRFGDDIKIFTKSKEEANAIFKEIERQLNLLHLHINQEKSGIFLAITRRILGYEFYKHNGKILIRKINRLNKTSYDKWHNVPIKRVDNQYHIIQDGILSKKDFHLLFENENTKRLIPVDIMDNLNIYSDVIFSSNFFNFANREAFNVNLFNYRGENIGRFVPAKNKRNIRLELAQLKLFFNDKERLRIAKKIENASIFNLRATLRYYFRRINNKELKEVIDFLTGQLKRINEANNINTLMMYEAQARQKYYSTFKQIINEPEFRFIQRTRRPPKDPINALISFANTLLYNRFANEIFKTNLDIKLGILHSAYKRNENLNLDLADIYKPIIADRIIFTMINRKMLDAKRDFMFMENGGVYLGPSAKRQMISQFEKKLSQKVNVNGKRLTYGELMRKELKNLEKYLLRNEKYQPYKYVN